MAINIIPTLQTCFIIKWNLDIHYVTKRNKSSMQYFFINLFRYSTYNANNAMREQNIILYGNKINKSSK